MPKTDLKTMLNIIRSQENLQGLKDEDIIEKIVQEKIFDNLEIDLKLKTLAKEG